MASFAKAFRQASLENSNRRLEAEKQAAKKAEAGRRKEPEAAAGGGGGAAEAGGGATGPGGAGNGSGSGKDNIFANFHSAQKASAGDLMAEFKMKTAQKRNALLSSAQLKLK